ncbi:MAG: hypothetical protein VB032_04310 [Burkholderiaceae bacterium]|nr:hypothetical protein [Burkholderiaceae bacterium]
MTSSYSIDVYEDKLDKYFLDNNISNKTQHKLVTSNIIAVPSSYPGDEYYFAQDTIDFLKYCNSVDPTYFFDLLADNDIKVLTLHSFDIFLPVIWIASSILLPLMVNLASSYIWEKLKGREHEDAQVEFTLIIIDDDKKKRLYYNGDAKTFKDTFEKIDISRL